MRFRALPSNEKRRTRLRNNWKLNSTNRSSILLSSERNIARLKTQSPGYSKNARYSGLHRQAESPDLPARLLVDLVGGNPDTGTKRGLPVPIISRRRGIWPTSRHRAIHHRRLEVTQINEQPVQLLKEIDESGIVRVVNVDLVHEPAT